MTINTYAPSDVTLMIDGYKVNAWESIGIERDRDSYTFVAGIRGKNTRVRNYDKAATIRIEVLQTSEAHDILNEIHRKDIVDNDTDEEATTDSARLVVTLKDKSGTSAFQSEDAYIVGFPKINYSQDFESRVWVIKCLTTSIFKIGGNLRPTTSVMDSIFNNIFNG